MKNSNYNFIAVVCLKSIDLLAGFVGNVNTRPYVIVFLFFHYHRVVQPTRLLFYTPLAFSQIEQAAFTFS